MRSLNLASDLYKSTVHSVPIFSYLRLGTRLGYSQTSVYKLGKKLGSVGWKYIFKKIFFHGFGIFLLGEFQWSPDIIRRI